MILDIKIYILFERIEDREMKNPYKRTDIFRCVHDAHRKFQNKISVYHILKEKNCYPNGCFYFRWRCKQLNKKNKCYRGFTHVGRKCFGCRDFYEEKIHNFPELQVSLKDFNEFRNSITEFEDWLEEVNHKQMEIAGEIAEIKPHFKKKIYPKTSYLSFRGYLLIFKEVYLDRIQFEDPVYGFISAQYYKSLGLARGDRVEAFAQLGVESGRLVLSRLRGVLVTKGSETQYWDEQKVVVAQEMASEFNDQPDECLQCRFGSLVDVEYYKDSHAFSHRSMLCLKGVADYKNCYVRPLYCGLDKEADDVAEISCNNFREMVWPDST